MCVSPPDSAVFLSGAAVNAEPVSASFRKLKVILTNVRGLKQASAELSLRACKYRPHLIGLVETHLCKDALSGLLPQGYSVVGRLDRSKHGGGLLWCAQSHLLVDKINLKDYNIVSCAEMLGIRCMDEEFILCYTPNSSLAPLLVNACENYKLDNPMHCTTFLGDFNVHNPDWIVSISPADPGGIMAEEFCQLFGYNQVIDFATHNKGNTLDLVITHLHGKAVCWPGLGTSDHFSIGLDLDMESVVPPTPIKEPTLLWQHAPWDHIKGAVRRALDGWDPMAFEDVDDAEKDLDNILQEIIDHYLKKSKPRKPGPVIWWNESCQNAYDQKLRLFAIGTKTSNPAKYNAAINQCRTIQRRAFARYNYDLKVKLSNMEKGDKAFWKITKEIGGISASLTRAAPSVEALAVHFAKKMSNGKDDLDDHFVPIDTLTIPLKSFKIRYGKVLKVLKGINPSKSANGIAPIFWKMTADVVALAVTKLFKMIVRKGKFVTRWKTGRVTPPHKRGSVMEPSNYRPLKVLINLSVYFESTIDDQLDIWITNFIPGNQFGFVKGTGTNDYGAALSFKIMECLDRRGEGILISFDVKGAFDRVWWARLKSRLKAKGMRRKALKLLYSYLHKRFLKVVHNGEKSSAKEIFSGVPQGAKWSPKFWDFDISEMEHYLSALAMLICYADDCGVWYEITDENRDSIVERINADLRNVLVWAESNKTTFEPTKTHFTLISRRSLNKFSFCFPLPRLVFDGVPIKRKPAVKLVGYTFDEEMTWASMIGAIATKARVRLGMLNRLRPLLSDHNMEAIYTSFIRPIMEYGSMQFMGAADTHLKKLDTIHEKAQRIGNFTLGPLKSRREAAAISFTLKLLDGKGRGVLDAYVPVFVDNTKLHNYSTQNAPKGLQIKDRSRHKSLISFDRSYLGCIHKIWKKLPNELVQKGAKDGWLKIKKSCTITITKGLKIKKGNKRAIKTPVLDGFTIGGFKASRTSEFENK